MVIILKPRTKQEEIDRLTNELEGEGVKVNPVIGTDLIILGLVGDTSKIDALKIEANDIVEKVIHVGKSHLRRLIDYSIQIIQ